MQPTKGNAIPAWALGAAAAFTLSLGFFAIDASRVIQDALAPSLGEIIRFVPSHGRDGPPHSAVSATVVASLFGGPTARVCELSPREMSASGGSMVIEARVREAAAYVVHWAGGATSQGDGDCGPSAELMVSAKDLTALIWASSPRISPTGMLTTAG